MEGVDFLDLSFENSLVSIYDNVSYLSGISSLRADRAEIDILNKMGRINTKISLPPVANSEHIISAREVIDSIHISNNIQEYIVSIIFASRNPSDYGLNDITTFISLGASPRATIFMATASKAHAFLNNRGYVIPDDVSAVGIAILRHRILLTYEAEAEEISSEHIIQRIYESVPTP